MRFILTLALTLALSTPALASDFYYRCHGDYHQVELDFNLTRGTWVSIKGLSPYWSHLMLVKVTPDVLIFEATDAGEGELSYVHLAVPKSFIAGGEQGTVTLSDIGHPDSARSFECQRDPSQED